MDGSGAPPIRDAALLIQGRHIVEMGPAASVHRPGGLVTELLHPAATLLPGLIDPHFHAGYNGHVGMTQLEWPATLEYAAVCAGANAARSLSHGYTGVLDVGCRGQIAVATRDAIDRGVIPGPAMRASGQILSSVGGPLDLWPPSFHVDPATRLAVTVTGVDEIVSVIRRQRGTGVDNIKVMVTASTVQATERGSSIAFTDDELRAATRAAHDNGLSAAAHAEGPEGVTAAVMAGFDTIQHASFVDDRTLDILEAHPRSTLVFTLGVYRSIIDRGPSVGYPEPARAHVIARWPEMLAGVLRTYDRGVPFAVGSDCGGAVHPHGLYAQEIVVLVRECGIPVEHAVRAATSTAAIAAGLDGAGRLQPGALADLVLVNGDLSVDPEHLLSRTQIERVLKSGVQVGGTSNDRPV